MRRLITYATAFALFFALADSARAYVSWTAAGWYVVEENPGGSQLYLGPLADEATCRANMPPEEEEAYFECKYFAEKPTGDNWY